MMRCTKIIATVGPASRAPETLHQMLVAGVDVFRLNFSHGTQDSHAETYHAIRKVAADVGRHIAIMQDLSGPKIRTGPLAGDEPLKLIHDAELRIAAGDRPGEPGRVFTPYRQLIEAARPDDRFLLDDGRIELRVVRRDGDDLVTRVVSGGLLGGHKGINAPGVPLPPSALTSKDEDDLRFGLALGVDFVALSFVQTADDVRRARELAKAAGRRVPVI